MRIIRFLGGLGNQMFQYACYKTLAKMYPNVKADLNPYLFETAHNGYELEDIFDVSIDKLSPFMGGIFDTRNRKWINRKIRRLVPIDYFRREERKGFNYDPLIFSETKYGYYSGFWQNESYFKDIAQEIRNDFRFKPLTDQKNLEVLEKISQTNSVSVHVRRGDYVNDPSFGGICEKDYYQEAIQYMRSKTDAPTFFVFSNDIEWCKNNLDINYAEFVSWNTGTKSYIDMQLMSLCKHNIIANSSFSWWGAWLNNNPEKIVIGPKKWLNDPEFDTSTLLPESWIKL